jgi:hypothetical protein
MPRKAIGMLMNTCALSKWTVNMSCEPSSMPRESDTVSIQSICMSRVTVNMIMGAFTICREQLKCFWKPVNMCWEPVTMSCEHMTMS